MPPQASPKRTVTAGAACCSARTESSFSKLVRAGESPTARRCHRMIRAGMRNECVRRVDRAIVSSQEQRTRLDAANIMRLRERRSHRWRSRASPQLETVGGTAGAPALPNVRIRNYLFWRADQVQCRPAGRLGLRQRLDEWSGLRNVRGTRDRLASRLRRL
jgi:hypothetical protein